MASKRKIEMDITKDDSSDEEIKIQKHQYSVETLITSDNTPIPSSSTLSTLDLLTEWNQFFHSLTYMERESQFSPKFILETSNIFKRLLKEKWPLEDIQSSGCLKTLAVVAQNLGEFAGYANSICRKWSKAIEKAKTESEFLERNVFTSVLSTKLPIRSFKQIIEGRIIPSSSSLQVDLVMMRSHEN